MALMSASSVRAAAFPQGGFQLSKGLFDQVQVGTVVGQIVQRRASSLNRLPDSSDFMGWQLPA